MKKSAIQGESNHPWCVAAPRRCGRICVDYPFRIEQKFGLMHNLEDHTIHRNRGLRAAHKKTHFLEGPEL